MAIPTITALYGSLNAILNVALALRVSKARRLHKVSTGIGDSKELEIAVRIHANNAEFGPLAILMILLAELCGGSSGLLHVLGGSLLVARIAHVVGMPMRAPNIYRVASNVITWGGILVASFYVLWLRMKG